MAKVLITGATGFIGKHLVQALRARGDEVRCAVRDPARGALLREWGAELVPGDVTRGDAWPEAVRGVGAVYHLAGRTQAFGERDFRAVNADGVRQVLTACAAEPSPPVFVLVSSLAAAGPAPPDRPRREEDPPCPVSHYGRSKLAGEEAAREFAASVPITLARPPIVLGEYDANGLKLFQPIRRHGVHLVPGRATTYYSFVHASDLAHGLILAAEQGERLPPIVESSGHSGQGCYFLAAEEMLTFAEFGAWLAEALGRSRIRTVKVPLPMVRGAGWASDAMARMRGRPDIFGTDKVREAAAGSWTCSTERAQEHLGFRPQKPLQARLRQTAQWYFDQRWLK